MTLAGITLLYILLVAVAYVNIWFCETIDPEKAKSDVPWLYYNSISKALYAIFWPYTIYRLIRYRGA